MLSSILVLPLMLPALIFGVSAAQAALGGTISFQAPFLILCAISLFSLFVSVVASAAALRALE